MFIIFKDIDNNTQMVNSNFIEYVGTDSSGDYVVETQEHSWEISEDQFLNIIKRLNNIDKNFIAADCRIYVGEI